MGFVWIPEAQGPQRDQCVAALQAAQSAGAQLYAVVDLAASTDAAHWHAKLGDMPQAQNLFTGQPESAAAEQAPWLVQLEPDANPLSLLRRSVDEALAAQNVTWLASALPLAELQARLSRRLTAQLPDGEALFRYYDTRLLPSWWAALTVEEQAAFGAFGSRWYMLDADLVLQSIALAGEPADDPVQPPWQLSEAQRDALTETSERHQLLGFLDKRQPDSLLAMSRGERWQRVCRYDAQARALHVRPLADRLRFCELALQHGEDFAQQADWQPVWAALQADDKLRLAAAIERVRPAE